jgi:hypothetical protein
MRKHSLPLNSPKIFIKILTLPELLGEIKSVHAILVQGDPSVCAGEVGMASCWGVGSIPGLVTGSSRDCDTEVCYLR